MTKLELEEICAQTKYLVDLSLDDLRCYYCDLPLSNDVGPRRSVQAKTEIIETWGKPISRGEMVAEILAKQF